MMQPSTRVGVLSQVGEVGQDQVDARHLDVGKHQAAVEDQDPSADLHAGAVAADLPQAAQEDDPDWLISRGDEKRPSRARVLEPVRGRTERQAALASG